MDAPPIDRFERVRQSLLHLGLRQITEEPGPDQPSDFARRKARLKQNRQDLDNFRAKQSAARVAAEARIDGELRARLVGQSGCGIKRPSRSAVATSQTIINATRPANQMQGALSDNAGSAGRRSSSRVASPVRAAASRRSLSPQRISESDTIEYQGKSVVLTSMNTMETFLRLNIETDVRPAIAASPSTTVTPSGVQDPTTNPFYAPFRNPRTKSKIKKSIHQSAHDASARSPRSNESNLVDRTRSSQGNITNRSTPVIPSRLSSRTAGHSVSPDDGNAVPNGAHEAAANKSQTTSRPSRTIAFPTSGSAPGPNHDISRPSNDQREPDKPSPSATAFLPRSGCTSKHFRVRNINGRDSIDGDTYYVVSWRSSWVPSALIKTREGVQERYIKIDGKDWRIAGTIKRRVKKGIPKELVRWVDDTMEPVKRLQRAISAIEDFELKPRLDRRVVSLDESLIDQTMIIPRSNEDFREAQVHLAKHWPMIAPRNDKDLLPAFRQIILELLPRRDDERASRKTHQRLIDRPQLRHLCWNEEYLLSGRFYECTPPKRNALLLQVVAEGVGDGYCERCVTDIAPFKECARDIAEDNPWLNGACANCGTAEANSTCCHHIYGTAHLDRGRSKGLTSERLREFINPTRSIELLKRLEFEDDDDSDTYSGDSYAESDNSALWEPGGSDDNRTINDSEDENQDGASTIDNFLTPGAPPEDKPNSPRQESATDSDSGSGGLFVSPATRSISPFQLPVNPRVQERSASRSTTAYTLPGARQARRSTAVATSSGKTFIREAAGSTERPSLFDRSSVTIAVETPASKFAYDNAAQYSSNDDTDDSSQLLDFNDMYGDVDSPFVPESTNQDILEESTTSSESVPTSASRAAAIQSVEAFGRTPATHASDMNAASSTGPQVSLHGPRGRKRAASQPSEHEPATFRSSTGSSHSSRGAFNHSKSDVRGSPSRGSSVNAVAESSSSSETKIDRGSTHEGCRAKWPCRQPDNATPDDGTLTIVYRDTVDSIYQLTIGEVHYILSRCTCHWASAFTKVWNGWREEPDASADGAEELTKPQYLLLYWAERLLEAARECCPTDPMNREIIIID